MRLKNEWKWVWGIFSFLFKSTAKEHVISYIFDTLLYILNWIAIGKTWYGPFLQGCNHGATQIL